MYGRPPGLDRITKLLIITILYKYYSFEPTGRKPEEKPSPTYFQKIKSMNPLNHKEIPFLRYSQFFLPKIVVHFNLNK